MLSEKQQQHAQKLAELQQHDALIQHANQQAHLQRNEIVSAILKLEGQIELLTEMAAKEPDAKENDKP